MNTNLAIAIFIHTENCIGAAIWLQCVIHWWPLHSYMFDSSGPSQTGRKAEVTTLFRRLQRQIRLYGVCPKQLTILYALVL